MERILSACCTCRHSEELLWEIDDSIRCPNVILFDGCEELEVLFRKILKFNTEELSQFKLCQNCRHEFRRIYLFLHRCQAFRDHLKRFENFETYNEQIGINDEAETVFETFTNYVSSPQKDKSQSINSASTRDENDRNERFHENVMEKMEATIVKTTNSSIANEPLRSVIYSLIVESNDQHENDNMETVISNMVNEDCTSIDEISKVEDPESNEDVASTKSSEQKRSNPQYNRKLVCDECDATFSSVFKLGMHKQTCKAKLATKQDFDPHREDDVIEVDTLTCNKAVQMIKEPKSHNEIHGATLIECNICGLKFPRLIELTNHKMTHSMDVFECNQCGGKFEIQRYFEFHRLEHTGVKSECNLCNSKLTSWSSLLRHKRAVHYRYECDRCGEEFKDLSVFHRHQQTHINEQISRIRSFKCKECNIRYLTAFECKYHRRSCHYRKI